MTDLALSIKHPEADRLARELAERTGETLTEAVINALRERLARETGRVRSLPLSEELRRIGARCAALPVSTRARRSRSSDTTSRGYLADRRQPVATRRDQSATFWQVRRGIPVNRPHDLAPCSACHSPCLSLPTLVFPLHTAPAT